MTRKYELLYVLNGTLRADQLKAQMERVHEIVSSVAEEITEEVEWGRRRLAYEIRDVHEGYYVIVHFNIQPDKVSEIERLLRISDDVLRYLVVLAEGSFMPSGRRSLADEQADAEKKESEDAVLEEPLDVTDSADGDAAESESFAEMPDAADEPMAEDTAEAAEADAPKPEDAEA